MAGSFLDPALNWILNYPPVIGILIISIIVTVISTLAYKYLTDQKKIKHLRAEMKTKQKTLKELSKKDPKKAMKMQQEMMSQNMELMKHSFKPMLYTFLPIIIIFGWLNAHLAFMPLLPDEPFDIILEMDKGATGNVSIQTIPQLQVYQGEASKSIGEDNLVKWTLRGDAGEYLLRFSHNGYEAEKNIIITEEFGLYETPQEALNTGAFKEVNIGNQKVRPITGAPIIGNWGWLGVYILFSFALSFGLRKALKVA